MMMKFEWRKQPDGSRRCTGDGLHLSARAGALRSQETARVGQNVGEGARRVPPRAERTEQALTLAKSPRPLPSRDRCRAATVRERFPSEIPKTAEHRTTPAPAPARVIS